MALTFCLVIGVQGALFVYLYYLYPIHLDQGFVLSLGTCICTLKYDI